jgi:hypothetical protein
VDADPSAATPPLFDATTSPPELVALIATTWPGSVGVVEEASEGFGVALRAVTVPAAITTDTSIFILLVMRVVLLFLRLCILETSVSPYF